MKSGRLDEITLLGVMGIIRAGALIAAGGGFLLAASIFPNECPNVIVTGCAVPPCGTGTIQPLVITLGDIANGAITTAKIRQQRRHNSRREGHGICLRQAYGAGE